MTLPLDEDRCTFMDDGCRCLRPRHHQGPHDPALTLWSDVLEVRRQREVRRRLQARWAQMRGEP